MPLPDPFKAFDISRQFPKLDGILDSPFEGSDTEQLLRQTERLQERALQSGIDPSLLEPRESLFSKALNFIDKPKQAALGLFDSAFIRRDIGDVGITGAIDRAFDERANFFDVLRKNTELSPVARGALGLAGEIALDPLNLITGGAKGLASAGGKAITDDGLKFFGKFTDEIVRTQSDTLGRATDDAIFDTAQNVLPEIQQRAAKLHDDLLEQSRYVKSGKLGTDLDTTETVRRSRILDNKKALDEWGFFDWIKDEVPGLAEDADTLDALNKIFHTPSVKFETGVPLLGHFQKKKNLAPADAAVQGFEEILQKEATPSLKARFFEGLGDIVSPGKISLGEVEIPRPYLDAMKNARDVVGRGFRRFDEALDAAAEGAEGVGGAATKVAKESKDFFKALGGAYARTFHRSLLGGRRLQNATESFQNEKAAADAIAQNEVLETLGALAIGDENKGLREIITKEIDRIGSDAFAEFGERLKGMDPQLANKVKDELNAVVGNPNAPLTAIKEVAEKYPQAINPDELFITRLAKAVEEGDIARGLPPEEQEEVVNGILSVSKAFQRTLAEERKLGIRSGFLDAYVPHYYTNAVKKPVKGSVALAPKEGFQQSRKFNTVEEAFTKRGLVAEKDISDLLYRRIKQSHQLRAEKRYIQRAVIEHGVGTGALRGAWNDAYANPNGEAAKIFKREGLPISAFNSHEELFDILEHAQSKGDEALDVLVKQEHVRNYLAKLPLRDVQEFFNGNTNILDAMRKSVVDSGIDLKDAAVPQGLYGELGVARYVKMPDGSSHVLPNSVADAVGEIIESRDIVRDTFGKSALGDKVLGAMDSVTNTFKKILTVPWPAYWGQNVISDTFLRLADGGLEAVEPGIMARTLKVLEGSGSIVQPNGLKISPEVFKKAMRANGITFSIDEFVDVLKAQGDMNLERLVKSNRGVLKNLKPGSIDAGAALDAAQANLRNTFENFFRVNHFVHHLERGSSLPDAARMASDAMINYRSLSPTEKSIFRRFYMFYGWISKSTKRTMNQMFFSPGELQQQIKGVRAFSEMLSDPSAAPSFEELDKRELQSLAAREQLTFPLGKGKDGKQLLGRGFGLPLNTPMSQFTANLPRNLSVGEILDTTFENFSRTAQKQFATANPIFKGVAERVTGRNLYFDKPLSAKFLRQVPSMVSAAEKLAPLGFDAIPKTVWSTIDDATKSFLGGVEDGNGNIVVEPGKFWVLMNVIPGLARATNTMGAFSKEDIPLGTAALRNLTGIRVETGDVEKSALFEDQNRLKQLLIDKSVGLQEQQRQLQELGLE